MEDLEKLNKIEEKILDLKRVIEKWNSEYYQNNNPSVDDYFYDQKLKELIELENKYPQFKTEDSPTQNVGGFADSKFKKAKHNIRSMFSLKNAFNESDLLHFDEQIKKIVGEDNYSYVIEPKIDGLSISLNYRNGKIYQAITRGDGKVGEDVTNNLFLFKNLPREIKIKEEIDFRGEVYISLDQFNNLNKQRMLENEKLIKEDKKPLLLFANPRNLASGTLRHLDKEISSKRELNLFIFQALSAKKRDDYFSSQIETLNKVKEMGFSVNENNLLLKDIKDVIFEINKFASKRESLNYEVDGIVIKVNEYKYHNDIGYTTKFPKWAIAYKFPTEIKKTKLLDIFPTVGRTGKITYNAKLKKVNILGTNVERATLHNADYIKSLDIRIGTEVYLKKAGEIIPKIISVVDINNNLKYQKWEEVLICPICKSKLIRFKGEVDQYCLNTNCTGRIIESLNHFVSKKGMDIEGLSKQQIIIFYQNGLIKSIYDIYNLRNKKDQILAIKGYQEKSVNNLLNSINKSKKNNLNQLIFALGIRNIGEKAALDLARKYQSIIKLKELSFDELNNFNDFGEVKAKSVVEWFKNPNNLKLIDDLDKLGVNLKYIGINIDQSNRLYNQDVLVTGTIEDAKREQIKNYLKDLGANYKSSPTKNLKYLFVGKNASKTKVDKIKKNSITEIIYVDKLSDIK
ncbi:DNA ligase [Candidatus Hepatoplasma crinochetorum Av]|uniref:DNA ligase n=1 Tax=Candidatus Hepatoplasma crinochetorum Av TaxID=1427984 RepID=W8GK93_9MOLU|nr:NAD-dependent DNA ligase LigA [Candidatus Hepatoplasma crinochetorum]AHK22667.1 DNA ligase [Candidatus Hepatoplasma crinochetorum Av]